MNPVLGIYTAVVSTLAFSVLSGMAIHKWWIYRSLREEFGEESLDRRQFRIIQGGKGS